MTSLWGLLCRDAGPAFVQSYATEGERDYHAARIINAVAFLHRDTPESRWVATTNIGRRLPELEQVANDEATPADIINRSNDTASM